MGDVKTVTASVALQPRLMPQVDMELLGTVDTIMKCSLLFRPAAVFNIIRLFPSSRRPQVFLLFQVFLWDFFSGTSTASTSMVLSEAIISSRAGMTKENGIRC